MICSVEIDLFLVFFGGPFGGRFRSLVSCDLATTEDVLHEAYLV